MMKEKMIVLEIPRRYNDERVDSALTAFLAEKFPKRPPLSRGAIVRALLDGTIEKQGGEEVLPHSRVATHDVFLVAPHIFEKKVLAGEKKSSLAIPILFENESFLVLDKPAGIKMHESSGSEEETVASFLLSVMPEVSTIGEDPARPGIVHRLDRDTSGVLIVAKTNEVFQALKKSFQERAIQKRYTALVPGHLETTEGSVDAILMRKSGELRRRAVDARKYEGVLPGNARTAFTEYRVLRRYREYDLVELSPKTGRTHQIRVHLAFLGHPVVGDRLYSFKDAKRGGRLFPPRQLLHATSLSFTLFGKAYQFRSQLPEDFSKTLKSLDETIMTSYDDEALKSLF